VDGVMILQKKTGLTRFGSYARRARIKHDQIAKANRGNHKTERQQLGSTMDQNNNRADPDFKDQFREAVETIGDGGTRVPTTTAGELLPTAMNRISRSGGSGGDPSFKAQIQRGLKSGRLTPPPHGNNGNDVPIAQAVAVDNSTNNSDGVPVVVPPTPTPPTPQDSVVMVLKISKRTLYWLLGILLVLIGVSTIIGGVCRNTCRIVQNVHAIVHAGQLRGQWTFTWTILTI
jgi:hypothetical protein